MNTSRAVDAWFRERPAAWFLALALLTGTLYGGGQFLFGRSVPVAVASGVVWGVLWAGGFFALRRFASA